MSGLFRDEVIASHKDKLLGEAHIAVPISWQAICYLLLFGLISAIIFISTSNFSRVETAYGLLTPDKGVSTILPARIGTVANLVVEEGQHVEAGDILAHIRTEEDSDQSASPSQQIEQAITRQGASLNSQIEAANAAAAAQQSQLAAQQTGLRSEIGQIQSQIAIQKNLIGSARNDFDRAQAVAERGFISQRDLLVREETLLARQQALSQLNQNLSTKRAALEEIERSSVQLAAQARVTNANLEAARAQVDQQAASTAGSRSYVLRAPISGTVTAITVRIGQPADPQNPLMTIVPSGAELQAELAVPSSAIGFVEVGQEVSLSIDAFPYQRFGTVQGTVLTVAESALRQQSADGAAVPIYPVRVRLNEDAVTAFGRDESLMPGMALSARIATEERSLLEWLFEPLYAVRRR